MPEVGTAVRSLTVALNGSLVVAANNAGTCYVWRMLRGASLATHFEPLHKLRAHAGKPHFCCMSATCMSSVEAAHIQGMPAAAPAAPLYAHGSISAPDASRDGMGVHRTSISRFDGK